MAERMQPGQTTFPTGEFNRHGDAADIVLGTELGKGAGRLRLEYDTNRITVKNDSGADRARGEILEFTGMPLTDLTRDLWLTGGAPTLVNGFGVLLNPIKSGKYGNKDCQIAGVCPALVNVTDADHRYALVAASTYLLQSAAIGPVRILYKPGTGSSVMCTVLLNDSVGEVLVKNTTGSSIAAGSSGTFEIFSGTPGSEATTGQSITAYNKSSVAFANNKFGSCSLLNGYAYAVPWQT